MLPRLHLCQGGILATVHGIASLFLKVTHPGNRDVITDIPNDAIHVENDWWGQVKFDVAYGDVLCKCKCAWLPGPSWGLHRDCTPGTLYLAWTPCRLAAKTQPTRTTRLPSCKGQHTNREKNLIYIQMLLFCLQSVAWILSLQDIFRWTRLSWVAEMKLNSGHMFVRKQSCNMTHFSAFLHKL